MACLKTTKTITEGVINRQDAKKTSARASKQVRHEFQLNFSALTTLALSAVNKLMPVDPTNAIVVFITAANRDEAVQLAEMMVAARLAACVQILPEMESVYRWQGNIERQREVLIIAKTTTSKFEELEREVRAIHSYDTPEIVAFPLTAVSGPYLKWLKTSIGDD